MVSAGTLYRESLMPFEKDSEDRPGRVPPSEPSDPPGGRADPRAAPSDPPSTGRPVHHVLIAEDEPHIARMLETLFEDAEMRVTLARDGHAALDAIRSDATLSLAVLDLMMPGMSGLEVLEEARRLAQDLPILVLTAKGEGEVRQRALELGATDLFIKPFSPRRLVGRVRELCER